MPNKSSLPIGPPTSSGSNPPPQGMRTAAAAASGAAVGGVVGANHGLIGQWVTTHQDLLVSAGAMVLGPAIAALIVDFLRNRSK